MESAVMETPVKERSMDPSAEQRPPPTAAPRAKLPTPKRRRKWLAPVLALLLAGAGVGTYLVVRAPAKAPVGAVVSAHRGNLVETAAASGKIESTVQVEVKSKASGAVAELLVKEGDHVEAGQLLVRLDKKDAQRALDSAKLALDRAKADIASTQASIRVAQLDLENDKVAQTTAEKAVELGVGSAEAARNAKHATDVASANLGVKSAQLTSGNLSLKSAQLAVDDAQTQLENTDIYAPMAGTILSIPVEVGTIVSSALTSVNGGTSVLTLADLSKLRVIGSIGEALVAKVSPEQGVDIRVDAFPNRVFKGVVDRVSPLGTEVSNVVTFDVEIRITDENQALLRSGMSADVEIVTSEQKDVILIPLTAVQTKGRQRFVTLASGKDQPIETGGTDGAQMVVTKGLEDGDSIREKAPVDAPAAKAGGQQRVNNPMGMGGPPRSMGGR
ncbi:MAG: efflux RND transporter periplasmic adaptor subunit [Polyangiaceae bacterium]